MSWICRAAKRTEAYLGPSQTRSSHRKCSVKIGVLKNFAKFTGKHLCQRFFFNKVAACNFIKKDSQAQAFSCEFWETSKNTFFTQHLQTTAFGRFCDQKLLSAAILYKELEILIFIFFNSNSSLSNTFSIVIFHLAVYWPFTWPFPLSSLLIYFKCFKNYNDLNEKIEQWIKNPLVAFIIQYWWIMPRLNIKI